MKVLTLFLALLLTLPGAAQPPSAAGLQTGSLTVNGVKRRYELFDPGKTDRPALVIMLHGGGGNAANARQMSQFDALAAKEGFLVAYPDGSGRMAPNLLTWNARHCCAYAMETKVDDVAFISALIDHLIATKGVDPKRVYVTGMSNGAMMSHRLGVELSGKIAAIAPVVGGIFGDEPSPKAPVAAMIIVGAEDRIVPGGGGELRAGVETGGRLAARRPAADKPVLPAKAAADFWAKANGCAVEIARPHPAAAHTAFSDCRDGADVHYYVVADNGHAWPGGRAGRAGANQPTQAFNASQVIWDFFAAHPKP